jgi:hypothetical protein
METSSVQAAPVRRRPVVHGGAVPVHFRGPRDRDQAEPPVPQVVFCLISLARLCCMLHYPWKVALKQKQQQQQQQLGE